MRKKLGTLISVLFLLVFLTGCQQRSSRERLTIMLVAEEDATSFGQELIQGIDAAVSEYTDVNILKRLSSATSEASYTKHLEQARQLHVDSVIITPAVLEENLPLLKEMKHSGITVVLLNRSLEMKSGFSSIGSDFNQIEEMLPSIALHKKADVPFVNIVSSLEQTSHYKLREQVWSKVLKQIDPSYQNNQNFLFGHDEKENESMLTAYLKEYPELSLLVATTESSALEAGRILKKIPETSRPYLIAADATLSIIKEMEQKTIQLAIRENPFEIGYKSVQLAIEQNRKNIPDKDFYVDMTKIDQQNIFEPSVQRLLFPLTK